MSVYRELSYDADNIESVRGVQFSVLPPHEIVKRSVVEVKRPDTFSGAHPVAGGLFDPHMGVMEHQTDCATCKQSVVFCPGHFGHVNLAVPVFHPMFFEHTRKLLRCLCLRCSRPLVTPDATVPDMRAAALKVRATRHATRRHEAFAKLCGHARIKKCGDDCLDGEPGRRRGCGEPVPSKLTRDGLTLVAEWRDRVGGVVEQRKLSAEDVLRVFRRLTDADIELLGCSPRWSRPEWLVATVLPVPPPAMRPSIIEEGGRREDDLTHKLADIVKSNVQIAARQAKQSDNETFMRAATVTLQYHVATFLNNNLPGLPPAQQRNGRRLKSVADRLRRKEGRVRSNLNGKRVDQSARSVITGDPCISIDEVGVPVVVASNLTFPEVVNGHNIDFLRGLVRRGPHEWPGAKTVRVAANGITYALRFPAVRDRLADGLAPGDVVDRHLLDGDPVLFNRQPSLHKMSMMCHRVRVMPGLTFRLNVLVTPPYNADFDGDEMNVHAPQALQTAVELQTFTAVAHNALSPVDGKPVPAVVQDVMTGAYRLSRHDVRLPPKVAACLAMVNAFFRPGVDALPASGRDAFAALLPRGLRFDAPNAAGERVRFGFDGGDRLDGGLVDKSVFSAHSRGVLCVAFHDRGPRAVRDLLDNLQRTVCRWLQVCAGFSVGVQDVVVPPHARDAAQAALDAAAAKVAALLERAVAQGVENPEGGTDGEALEAQVQAALAEGAKTAGAAAHAACAAAGSRVIDMIASGAKGKTLNVHQMAACLAQQQIEGGRVAPAANGRTLPHFARWDDGPEARGFVASSFLRGLTPAELFFHGISGRVGLIDTAVKTSDTGYTQRRLIKALEDAKIAADLTVRTAAGTVLQFLYGEDGMDGCSVERQPLLNALAVPLAEVEARFRLRLDDDATLRPRLDAHWDALRADRDRFFSRAARGARPDRALYPVPFDRLARDAVARRRGGAEPCTPAQALDALDATLDELIPLRGTPDQATLLPRLLVRAALSPRVLVHELALDADALAWFAAQVRERFLRALAPPSEMVGVVAAQSIGEFCTQLSVDGDTPVHAVLPDGTPYAGPIGQLVDAFLLGAESTTNASVVRDLPAIGPPLLVPAVDAAGNVGWARVSQVSRHPANGGLVRATTRSGRACLATLTHSFLTRGPDGRVVPVRGDALRMGDLLPVARHVPTPPSNLSELTLTYEDGRAAATTNVDLQQLYFLPAPYLRGVVEAAFRGARLSDDGGPSTGSLKLRFETAELRDKMLDLLPRVGALGQRLFGRDVALVSCPDAAQADIVWDPIVRIDLLPDHGRPVYDFSVPGAESFMVDGGLFVHNTLDSFHVSGTVAAVKATSGVPRLRELLGVSSRIKTPTLTVHLRPELSCVARAVGGGQDPRVKSAKARTLDVLRRLETSTLGHLLDSSEVLWVPDDADPAAPDRGLLRIYEAFEAHGARERGAPTPWLLRMRLDREKLYAHRLTVLDAFMALHAAYGTIAEITFSDDCDPDGGPHLRLRLLETEAAGAEDALAALRALDAAARARPIKGVLGIRKASMRSVTVDRYDAGAGEFLPVTEWVVDTDGTALAAVLADPDVDATRTRSNDPHEVHAVLGIEAARAALALELQEVLRDSSLNWRHLSLLVDVMTARGGLMSIDRHGINRGDALSPLAKSSFEETCDMLINASVSGELDEIGGISPNIMLGQMPPAGTGDVQLLLDEDAKSGEGGLAEPTQVAAVDVNAAFAL